jgi:NAD(P)-dependent dehydrogenase (short-subunit alcohol dehydrogenase family)
MVGNVMEAFGRVDILVNNAGVTNRQPLMDVAESEFDRVIGVNLKGPLWCTQAAVPAMRSCGGGTIINVLSITAEIVSPCQGVYAASKGGLRSLTRALAVELAPDKIRVNGILPGTTVTGINRERFSDPDVLAQRVRRIPLGRPGQPDDYAGPVILLASDASSWMTGSLIAVDGGLLSLA